MKRSVLLFVVGALATLPSASSAGALFADDFESGDTTAWSATVPPAGAAGTALRFFGNGSGDIDRVKIRIDDPAVPDDPGPPVDVGAADFTIEFWLRALPGQNASSGNSCAGNSWIFGNIVVDRDRFNQQRGFGLSISDRALVWGVDAAAGSTTICGTAVVDDGAWHHVAVQRSLAGAMSIYVDGVLDAVGTDPGGDVSYPDDGMPGNFCGGPCTNSDPFIVLGAEKHDAGPAFPSFSGWLDELRVSTVLRYAGPSVTVPSAPFTSDAATAGLYHFDEGVGDLVGDSAGAAGGPSHGERRFGGEPPGPQWVPSSAPLESTRRSLDLVK